MERDAFNPRLARSPPYARVLDELPPLRNDSAMAGSIQETTLSNASASASRAIRKEIALFSILLFLGLVILPVAIFWVGQSIFGSYGGAGYSDFFGTISQKIRHGDGVAWFLVLSPYLAWQCMRLLIFAWRRLGRES